jgi:biopolymer transport protein ExbB/TolQ
MKRFDVLNVQGVLVIMMSLSFCVSAPVHSQIYSWKDAQGVTHFSNRALDAQKGRQQIRLSHINRIDSLSAPNSSSNSKKKYKKSATKPLSRKRNLTARRKDDQSHCDQIRRQREALMIRLRKGYSLKEAKKLKAKKRRLSQTLWEECR